MSTGGGPERPEPEQIRWEVDDDDAGERLDRHVAARLDCPRNRVQGWIREGRVTVDGKAAKVSTPVAEGAAVACTPTPPAADVDLTPEDGPLQILYEDEDLVAVDKPAGLAVHPGAGRPVGTLAHRLLHRYPETALVGGRGRPGIVHRLDLDTTGVLLVARSEVAYRALSTAFAERWVDKRYQAVVYGRPRSPQGTVDLPLGRHPRDRKRMTVRQDGRPATTHYALRRPSESFVSVLDLDIETGRTHQIRVHLKAIGHPLVGDPVYGEDRWRGLPHRLRRALKSFPRPALHAHRIALDHPTQKDRRLVIEAPVPGDLRDLWRSLADEPWPEDGPPAASVRSGP
ncbi:MAG: RluA family pseudouridine synthase [Acidobacteriota bacterium]